MAQTTTEESFTIIPALSPTLTADEMARIERFSTLERLAPGTVIVEAGDTAVDLWVVRSGIIDIEIPTFEGVTRVGWADPGQFVGDVSVLSGGASPIRTRARDEVEALRIPVQRLRALLVEDSALSDLILSTFTARRARARSRTTASNVLIGPRYDRTTFEIHEFLEKNAVLHSWYDPYEDEDTHDCLSELGADEADMPIVILGAREVLRRPGLWALARRLGLNTIAEHDRADVVVLGAGPSGLAAAVYAASEGLEVITVDSSAAGGQAGTSSKIENYLGFPTGISGRQLAENAALQAQKFGARLAAPAAVEALEDAPDGQYRVRLADGGTIEARSVVIATGARYQRLDVEDLGTYEGAGVYYGATAIEGQLCRDAEVAIVGGGNSAGQGAVFLAGLARHVHILIRRDDLTSTMSEYLIRRIAEMPNITVHARCEVTRLHGRGGRLDALGVTCLTDGEQRRLETPFLFLMIGAQPCTEWLDGFVALDDKGFIKTGGALDRMDLVAGRWPYRREPSTYETSRPRVYAVGDVRAGSVKRVAAAVGEGSVVVHAIHRALADDFA